MMRLHHVTACLIAMAGLTAPLQATVFTYHATLDGPTEGNASPGIGTATVDYNDLLHTLRVEASFSGLLGTVTASHIHGPTAAPLSGTAGVATMTPTFLGFPSGVTAGTYDHTFDLTQASSFNSTFVAGHGGTPAGAEAALVSALADGKTYLNIHTNLFPGGEIRGFLTPEPGTLAILAVGATLVLSRRRRGRA